MYYFCPHIAVEEIPPLLFFHSYINVLQLKFLFTIIGFTLWFCSCDVQSNQFDPFLYGKVEKKIFSGADERTYLLHVPSGYIGSKALPLVVIFHDHGATAADFYETSGWREICERENLFAVFPQALEYCDMTTSGNEMKTGWNVSPVHQPSFCQGVSPSNDVFFIEKVLEKTLVEYNINKKNLYLAGFGEGGQMVANLLLDTEYSWTAATQFAGSFTKTHLWQSAKPVPVLFQVGNVDEVFFHGQIPVSLTGISDYLEDSSHPLFPVIASYQAGYTLSEAFQLAGDTTKNVKALFTDVTGKNLLEISMIKNVKHEYSSNNQFFQAAIEHWNWMKKFGGL